MVDKVIKIGDIKVSNSFVKEVRDTGIKVA